MNNVREKTERLNQQLRLQANGREQAIERSEHRRVVVEEADYAGGGRRDSRRADVHFLMRRKNYLRIAFITLVARIPGGY
jgi:hypothetical protein